MSDVDRAIADLDVFDLKPMTVLCARMAQRQADVASSTLGRRRLGDFWQALAAALDEERLRRERELQALEDSFDDEGGVGELVEDATHLSDEEVARMAADYARDVEGDAPD